MSHPDTSTASSNRFPVLILVAFVIAAAVVAAVLFSRSSQASAAKGKEIAPLASANPPVRSVLDSSPSASPDGMADKGRRACPGCRRSGGTGGQVAAPSPEEFRALAADTSPDPAQRKARARELLARLRGNCAPLPPIKRPPPFSICLRAARTCPPASGSPWQAAESWTTPELPDLLAGHARTA